MPRGMGGLRKAVAYCPHAARVRVEAFAQANRFRIVSWHGIEAGPLAQRTGLRAAVLALRAHGARWLLVDARESLGPPASRVALEALLGARRGVGRGFLVVYAEPDTVDDELCAAVRAGTSDAAEMLRHAQGRPPPRGERRYGWRRVRGQRVPDAYQQAVLARIAELRGEGLGAKLIARRLREMGYRGPDGKPIVWTFVGSQLKILRGSTPRRDVEERASPVRP